MAVFSAAKLVSSVVSCLIFGTLVLVAVVVASVVGAAGCCAVVAEADAAVRRPPAWERGAALAVVFKN